MRLTALAQSELYLDLFLILAIGGAVYAGDVYCGEEKTDVQLVRVRSDGYGAQEAEASVADFFSDPDHDRATDESFNDEMKRMDYKNPFTGNLIRAA